MNNGEGAMTSPTDPLDIALSVATAIESIGGQYFLGGSLASSLQGEPRATNHIDFVVDLPLGRLSAFRDALGGDFEVDLDMLRDAIRTARTANAFYLPTVTKIGFFGRAYDPYDEAEFARRRRVLIRPSGETLVVKAPEDTVLRKLLWYRAGGEVSDRQWKDIVSVLRLSGPEFDTSYLESWAKRLNLWELLGRAREDADRQNR
jgi:hypothetical protein